MNNTGSVGVIDERFWNSTGKSVRFALITPSPHYNDIPGSGIYNDHPADSRLYL